MAGDEHADPSEAAAINDWLKREGTCLLLAPHHDVGFTDDYDQRQEEYLHHGDRLVPRQQRFTTFTRDLMQLLDVPVHNVWGLRPALKDGDISPITTFAEADELGLLEGVPTLNFHPHLPHYEVTEPNTRRIRLLARQPVDLDRPHPFTKAGNTEFNIVLWMPPEGERKGDIVLVDSTHFTTLFGGTRKPRALLAQPREHALPTTDRGSRGNSGLRPETSSKERSPHGLSLDGKRAARRSHAS